MLAFERDSAAPAKEHFFGLVQRSRRYADSMLQHLPQLPIFADSLNFSFNRLVKRHALIQVVTLSAVTFSSHCC